MRDNPLSRIPTLVLDDGTVLTDSACDLRVSRRAGRWRHGCFRPIPRRGSIALRRHALGNGFIEVCWCCGATRRNRPPERRSPPHLAAYEAKSLRRWPHSSARRRLLARQAARHRPHRDRHARCRISISGSRDEPWRPARPAAGALARGLRGAAIDAGDRARRRLRRRPWPVRCRMSACSICPASWRGHGPGRSSPISAPTSSRSSGPAPATTRARGGRRSSRIATARTPRGRLLSRGQPRQALDRAGTRHAPRGRRSSRRSPRAPTSCWRTSRPARSQSSVSTTRA